MRRALLSVSDKTDLVPFAATLAEFGFELISTAGTARTLTEPALPVPPISALTGYPELLDGRVKTLHPAIAAAILADGPRHAEELAHHGIRPIDLGVVCEPAQYGLVQEELRRTGQLSPETRRRLAARAFARTAAYDAAIAARLADGDDFPDPLVVVYHRRFLLRYGENPHQRAALYTTPELLPGEVTGAELLQGKALSYNNLLDLEAAWAAVREFDRPAAVLIKHATPCGAALGSTTAAAVQRAFDADAAAALGTLFLEGLFAPEVTPEALAMLARRKNLRVLEAKANGSLVPALQSARMLRSLRGGVLVQDADALGAPREGEVVSRRAPAPEEWRDLHFAWLICKHVRSNAIVLAAGEQTVGVGGGQRSRVDSVRMAVAKAGSRARGSVLASDGFFPFPDGIEEAAAAGVTAVIQPVGSVRDPEVIAAADAAGVTVVFTGERHFRH